MESIKNNNYNLKWARVKFILYWKKEELDYEIRIAFPELCFEKAAN